MSPDRRARLASEAETYGADAVYGDLDSHDTIEVDLHWVDSERPLRHWARDTALRIPAGYEPVGVLTMDDLHADYLAHPGPTR